MNNNQFSAEQKAKMAKGFQRIGFGILLMFVGPVILYSTFKNESHPFYYAVLAIGILICISAMYLFFIGLKKLVSGIFND